MRKLKFFGNTRNIELETLKGLILFSKEEKIAKFKYKDFEFDLAQIDPHVKHLADIDNELSKLKDIMSKIKMAQEFKR